MRRVRHSFSIRGRIFARLVISHNTPMPYFHLFRSRRYRKWPRSGPSADARAHDPSDDAERRLAARRRKLARAVVCASLSRRADIWENGGGDEGTRRDREKGDFAGFGGCRRGQLSRGGSPGGPRHGPFARRMARTGLPVFSRICLRVFAGGGAAAATQTELVQDGGQVQDRVGAGVDAATRVSFSGLRFFFGTFGGRARLCGARNVAALHSRGNVRGHVFLLFPLLVASFDRCRGGSRRRGAPARAREVGGFFFSGHSGKKPLKFSGYRFSLKCTEF